MTHLELLNVALTWRIEQPGWPPVLVQSGYVVHAIGVDLVLPGDRRVAPDIVATCPDRGFTVLIEIKSGKGLEKHQFERMLAITPEDLRDLNHFPIRDPNHHRVQVLFVCHETSIESFERTIAARQRVAVAGFDGRRFRLAGDLVDNLLADSIRGIEIAEGAIPTAVLPFDHESPLAAVARHVIPVVVADLVAGASAVDSDGILRRTHSLVYTAMRPTGTKSELGLVRDRVTEVLKDAAHNELSEWLERRTPDQTWTLKRALASDASGRTRDLKALQTAANALYERLEVPGSQLPLFEGDL